MTAGLTAGPTAGGLRTGIDQAPVMETTLTMPYTLTMGRAAGTFLTELRNQRIVGTRCSVSGDVTVPPADFSRSGGETEFVVLPGTGDIRAWTRTPAGVLATIRLDGADTDLVHRIVGDTDDVRNGAAVRVVWAPDAEGFDVLAGFELGEAGQSDGQVVVTPLETDSEAIAEFPYRLDLDYKHSYGPFYGRMFDELGSHRRLVGTKCPSCRNVLVPARGNCDVCFVPTGQVVDVADTGTLQAFSVIHLEFVGQTRKPPYVYAEINLDGSATRLIHTVGGVDMARAEELLSIGMKVRAVWKQDAPTRGTLSDIDYFEPVLEDGSR
ncbi:Zn-ribbon domain-containing OB-fold protein [Actinokineospora sp.]|uniref:Zn-ribbon domain-containing OB-fold protein n=1 Tax=Actinokineospora sp. TaxID=1872133 RepID=UPI003D6A047C